MGPLTKLLGPAALIWFTVVAVFWDSAAAGPLRWLSLLWVPILWRMGVSAVGEDKISNAAENDPEPVLHTGGLNAENPGYFLGDVFSEMNEYGDLVWNARPVPGATLRFLIAAERPLSFEAAAWLAPFEEGPHGGGTSLDAEVFSFEGRKSAHRFIELRIPEDVAPGLVWLTLVLNDVEFAPRRLEVANPALLEERALAFAHAEDAVSGLDGQFRLSAPYEPIPAADLPAEFATEGSWWAVSATRVDAAGALDLEHNQASTVVVYANTVSGESMVADDVPFRSWTVYNHPADPTRGGYNGWWWRADRLPADGLCGTAWCNYPFPGNGIRTFNNTVAIAVPVEPNPDDWWLGQEPLCGNAWWHRRNRGVGPWWPRFRPPEPDTDDNENEPGEPESPGDDPIDDFQDDWGETTTPGLQPPPSADSCRAEYVEAVAHHVYDKPAYGRRLQHAVVGSQTAIYDLLPPYEGRLRWVRVPGGFAAGGGYTYGWTQGEVDAELLRNKAWWAQYCIDLQDAGITLPPGKKLQNFVRDYQRWLATLPPRRPGVKMGLGDTQTNTGARLFEDFVRGYRKYAGIPDGALHVLFMPRVVARTGHTAENKRRPTEASFTVPGQPIVVLHDWDSENPYILAHELIHALGRGGPKTWFHSSGDPRAMSRVTRQHVNQRAGLSQSRLLDYAEYEEILGAGLLKPR